MDWKGLLAKAGLWVIRVLIREGKQQLAKRVVEDVVADPKVPWVSDVLDLIPDAFKKVKTTDINEKVIM